MNVFDIAAVLVGLSTLFSYINYRVFHLPSTIGLVVISLAASLTVIGIDLVVPTIHIAEPLVGIFREIDFNETLMHGMLSFLLFAGGLHADLSMFKRRGWTIGVMALLGTLMSTFVVGGLMWFLLGIFDLEVPFIWALAFGALISLTDPVAVLGLFKIVKVPKSLDATMAGESMFNDGVGVVVFTVVVAISVGSGEHGGSLGPIEVVTLFLIEAGGGVVLGLIAGYIGYRAMHAIDDYNLEILITLAVVMVTYSFAIYVEMSGPIAMVVAGLFIGDRGIKYAMSEKTREYVVSFWSLIDEILNAVLFLLIGLEVLVIAGSIRHLGVALLAIPVTLFARALSVYIPMVMLSRWQSFGKGEAPVLIWGGLRGGIAVALPCHYQRRNTRRRS